MKLHELQKTTKKKSRRLGQGHGSGRVKTSGRGTKGQNARGKRPLWFEGGAVSLIKRLPFRRGKGRNKSFAKRPIAINLSVLQLLPKGTPVTLENLIKHKIVDEVDAKMYGVKLLGNGEVVEKLTVALPMSKHAAEKVTKAGGSITTV